jgi:hypothetical protein
MGESRERLALRSRISQRFLHHFKLWSSVSSSHPITQDIGGGSFGTEYPDTNHVLLQMEGIPYVVTVECISPAC